MTKANFVHSIATEESSALAQEAFAANGGQLVTTLFPNPKNLPRQDVTIIHTLVYTALGTDHDFGPGVRRLGQSVPSNMVLKRFVSRF
jgi:hypothetical protein